MLFNSLAFLLFFPIVVSLYWALPQKFRNVFMLLSSYYFYMNWEPIYALLILLSTATTYASALLIEKHAEKKRLFVTLSLLLNLGILFVYKYSGFFNTVVHDSLNALGIAIDIPNFELLLPVGISFYTFQAIGYTIDVYRGTVKAERNFIVYALFVSFFPQLVAGPIERAKNLLPQFHERHHISGAKFIEGLQMMMWGYFMKICIADNVATYVDAVFNNLPQHNGTSIALAALFFTFQIFCDFGGYSLIAIGSAHCIGITLMQNFKRPYLACSIRDFWRRWHISLTTWFTDYVYIPLGGNRCSRLKHKRNLIATFFISGIWHGANYTFVVWGLYHGILQVVQAAYRDVKSRFWIFERIGRMRILKIASVFATFALVVLGWIIFRANSVSDAALAIDKILFDHGMLYNGAGKPSILMPILLIGVLMSKEMLDEYRERKGAATNKPLWRSIASTSLLFIVILLCGCFTGGQFIYFQF